MKRLLALLLLGAMTLGLVGCAPEPAPTEPPQRAAAVTETAPPETTQAPTETEPPALEGSLFLKVSSIDFSLVGESEDIYLGVIPREQVRWESDDPDVVSVENGVLTANGVGSTTIRATYEDRQVECTAGCLAQTEEELLALDPEVLSAPKRMLPEIDLEKPCTYFDNSAIVGDSITYFLLQYESKNNYLGDMLFLCRGGVSMNGFVRRFKNIYYRGKEMHLEDAIAASQVERVYFLMGSNDVGDDAQRSYVFESWSTMLERIREQHPTVEIVLLSNTPVYDKSPRPSRRNQLIAEYNTQLRQFAAENGCLFVDLAYYIVDHQGKMAKVYNLDPYHMNDEGSLAWIQVLRYYAQYESEGGTLS